jgi:Coenzyme PQQ synthesis protein D (PqqD)
MLAAELVQSRRFAGPASSVFGTGQCRFCHRSYEYVRELESETVRVHSAVMSTPSLDSTVRIGEDTVFRELEGEAILLQLDAGMYFGLDPVGTRLWQLMAERGKLRDVFDAARQEFEVDPETLERDLLALVTHLAEKQLVAVD